MGKLATLPHVHELAPRTRSLATRTAVRIGASWTILFMLGLGLSEAADLQPRTLQAWETYVQTAKLAMDNRAAGRLPFLWVDESPDRMRLVRAGELLVSSPEQLEVPQGLIHHWIGAMFLPDVTGDEVIRVLHDYERYQNFYRPRVVKSKVLEQTHDYRKVTLVMVQKAFGVTGAVETDDEIHITKLGSYKQYSVSNSTRVQEIADYGREAQRLFPEDRGPGYIWRTFSVTRLERRDGGIYVEMEMITLSRSIPFEIGWLIRPVIEHISRTIMLETLKDTRDAVREQAKRTSGNIR